MALEPIDEAHALQIQAGALGRKAGHRFEDGIAASINTAAYPIKAPERRPPNLAVGNPADMLLRFIAASLGYGDIRQAHAISTGALATSEEGAKWLSINGVNVSRCKSDLVVTLKSGDGRSVTIGVSTKQCNNTAPTNAQIYFTTAQAFANLLRANDIEVSNLGLVALRQFCGEAGFRPVDDAGAMADRLIDPRRYFWEEVDAAGRAEMEATLANHQDGVTRLLLQKAYVDDPFVPEILLHKTKRSESWQLTEVAIYGIEELIHLSRQHQGFATRAYSVRKGSYKDPPGAQHLAPRFGIVQMQRAASKQHPTQLQFNLEAGYFYKL